MASRGINKAIIVGNLGNPPEMRYTADQRAIASFSVATSENWKDKVTGEDKSITEWHRISVFGKLAEICGQYLNKGSKVFIEGRIQTRKWQDQSGNDRYTTEIIANEMQMLDSRNSSDSANQNQGIPQQQTQQPAQMAQQQPAAQAQPVEGKNYDNFDDDIPF